jgi:hypothetical protein
VFRHGIQERRRSATQRAALDSQPDVIFFDTFFYRSGFFGGFEYSTVE